MIFHDFDVKQVPLYCSLEIKKNKNEINAVLGPKGL